MASLFEEGSMKILNEFEDTFGFVFKDLICVLV